MEAPENGESWQSMVDCRLNSNPLHTTDVLSHGNIANSIRVRAVEIVYAYVTNVGLLLLRCTAVCEKQSRALPGLRFFVTFFFF